MDWIQGIQRSIDYVEAHLDEDIDYVQAAREAAASPFHFQRVFSVLCGCTLGVCFSSEMDSSGFPYGIGAEYNGVPLDEEDALELIELPAATYAVFPCRGQMPDAFRSTYLRICSEFFPQSSYEYGAGTELEVYPSANTSDPDYYCEIWIAVKEKK